MWKHHGRDRPLAPSHGLLPSRTYCHKPPQRSANHTPQATSAHHLCPHNLQAKREVSQQLKKNRTDDTLRHVTVTQSPAVTVRWDPGHARLFRCTRDYFHRQRQGLRTAGAYACPREETPSRPGSQLRTHTAWERSPGPGSSLSRASQARRHRPVTGVFLAQTHCEQTAPRPGRAPVGHSRPPRSVSHCLCGAHTRPGEVQLQQLPPPQTSESPTAQFAEGVSRSRDSNPDGVGDGTF